MQRISHPGICASSGNEKYVRRECKYVIGDECKTEGDGVKYVVGDECMTEGGGVSTQ